MAPTTHSTTSSTSTTSSAKLAKKLRDTQRLLRKQDLPAHKKVQAERTILMIQKDLDTAKTLNKTVEIEKKHQEKYRMVKFMEKKKVVRKIKNLTRKIEELSSGRKDSTEGEGIIPTKEDKEEDTENKSILVSQDETTMNEITKCKGQLAEWKQKLEYIEQYDKSQKYVSLFPAESRQQETKTS